MDLARRRILEHQSKGVDQLEQAHLDLALAFGHGRQAEAPGGVDVASQQPTLRKPLGHLLVALVLQQSGDQLGTRIESLPLFVLALLGQQHAGLDERQGRCHDEVFAGNVEVELAHQFQILQVLPADLGNRDVGDLDLVLPNQMQQQVEGTLEDRELDRVGVCAGGEERVLRFSGRQALGFLEAHWDSVAPLYSLRTEAHAFICERPGTCPRLKTRTHSGPGRSSSSRLRGEGRRRQYGKSATGTPAYEARSPAPGVSGAD